MLFSLYFVCQAINFHSIAYYSDRVGYMCIVLWKFVCGEDTALKLMQSSFSVTADPPCPTMSCSGMGGTFQAGQKCEGCHSVAKKPSNPPCVSSQLLVDNSYKRVIPTHPRCIYRPMSAGDCPAVQTIHERCLPVRYSAVIISLHRFGK